MAIARYTLAVDRKFKRDGEQESDFIQCVAFGKAGEFAEKYFHKGIKIAIVGRITTGSYEKDGQRVYTTEVTIEEQEFAESKNNSYGGNNAGFTSGNQAGGFNGEQQQSEGGFMSVPDDAELPWS